MYLLGGMHYDKKEMMILHKAATGRMLFVGVHAIHFSTQRRFLFVYASNKGSAEIVRMHKLV